MTAPYYADEAVTLYCGKFQDNPQWLAADVLVTDPPYGMGYVSGWKADAIDGDETVELRDAALAAWGARPAVVFGRWSVARPAATRARLVWDKGEFGGAS